MKINRTIETVEVEPKTFRSSNHESRLNGACKATTYLSNESKFDSPSTGIKSPESAFTSDPIVTHILPLAVADLSFASTLAKSVELAFYLVWSSNPAVDAEKSQGG